jgi:hypothetical protein
MFLSKSKMFVIIQLFTIFKECCSITIDHAVWQACKCYFYNCSTLLATVVSYDCKFFIALATG